MRSGEGTVTMTTTTHSLKMYPTEFSVGTTCTLLQAAFRIARTKTRVAPVSKRVEACKLFLERAKKRVQRAQEVVDKVLTQRAVHEEEVAQGETPVGPSPSRGCAARASWNHFSDAVAATDRCSGARTRRIAANRHQEGKRAGPTDIQELHGWLSDRSCELRNAMEFGDAELVAKIGGLVGQGAAQLALQLRWMGNPVLR